MSREPLLHTLGSEPARMAMREHIERQRWYGGRGRVIDAVETVDAVRVREEPVELWLVLVAIHHRDGGDDLYHLPLARSASTATGLRDEADPAIVLSTPDVSIYDAMADWRCVKALWQAITAAEAHRGGAGTLRFTPLAGAGDGDGVDEITVRPLGKEQSNSAAVLGDERLLKCLRRVQPGVSPELEMTGALAAGGFEHVAPPLGSVEYVPDGEGSEPVLLALVQPFLHNGTEGFSLALTSLRDLYADAEERDAADPESLVDAARERGATFVPEAMRIGEVTAAMHLCLLRGDLGPALRPRPLGRDQLDAWAAEFTAELDRLLDAGGVVLDPLRGRRADIVGAFDALRRLGSAGMAIRVHGDLHLAQLLRTDAGWTVLDFEGEPARSLEERRRHSSALNDVAGLLRSLDYAAAVALADRLRPTDPMWEALLAHGEGWAVANRRGLWDAYSAAVAGTGLIPDGDDAVVLRRAFELRKAVYEVGYEIGHRPEWVGIPLRFLLSAGGTP